MIEIYFYVCLGKFRTVGVNMWHFLLSENVVSKVVVVHESPSCFIYGVQLSTPALISTVAQLNKPWEVGVRMCHHIPLFMYMWLLTYFPNCNVVFGCVLQFWSPVRATPSSAAPVVNVFHWIWNVTLDPTAQMAATKVQKHAVCNAMVIVKWKLVRSFLIINKMLKLCNWLNNYQGQRIHSPIRMTHHRCRYVHYLA